MEYSTIEHNCGIMLIHVLDQLDAPYMEKLQSKIRGSDREITFRERRDMAQKYLDEELRDLINFAEDDKYGIVMITTAEYQEEAIKRAEKFGFTKLDTSFNPNSGYFISIWTLHVGAESPEDERFIDDDDEEEDEEDIYD